MLAAERRVIAAMSGVYASRMLGLFMLLPVLALYADGLPGAGPGLIGLTLGIYGMTQAILQIPFGMLSDRFGRKPVIAAGLVLFMAGSVLGALADDIWAVIFARAMQGSGAVSAAVTALVADQTRDIVRTRAMAFLGITIGATFILSLVLGPLLSTWIGVPGLFWLTAVLAAASLLLVVFVVPAAVQDRKTQTLNLWMVIASIREPGLRALDSGIFLLHMVLTATFIAVPYVLRDVLALPSAQHWQIYLGAMVLSLLGTVPLILVSERGYSARRLLSLAVGLIVVAQILMAVLSAKLVFLVVLLAVIFSGFNFLEARFPAMISQQVDPEGRGAALGVYSTAQFLGTFAGGALGGWLYGIGDAKAVFIVAGLAMALWWRQAGRACHREAAADIPAR